MVATLFFGGWPSIFLKACCARKKLADVLGSHCIASFELELALACGLILGQGALLVLSNGRYKSGHHRAVTKEVEPRLSLAMFYGPNKDTVIGPIEDLIDEERPPL
ncbi:hypothetical protein L3X38_041052 [Prunus dulcis]|uniref:Isopenicillin N synthase-like Fe(2+) 2OG dioxygenase domain-containing protein n=1 Tax=Prunus dulcis TaxID=3755 RepID=A0AAD4USC1_PRUDU|nr:hypothetical protein L3X38_041052 [Prunus dulcis]